MKFSTALDILLQLPWRREGWVKQQGVRSGVRYLVLLRRVAGVRGGGGLVGREHLVQLRPGIARPAPAEILSCTVSSRTRVAGVSVSMNH